MREFETIRGHTVFSPPLGADAVVVDLGANHGEFARQMSARFGGRYYLVEAHPALVESLRAEGRFPIFHCAIAGTDGPILFHIAENDEGSSILSLPDHSVYSAVLRETVEVPGRTLESALGAMGVSRIDLMKIDIEGAEIAALRSLTRERLATIGQITVEFHSDPTFGFQLNQDVEDLLRSMRRHGFLCLDFSTRPRLDVLFLNLCIHHVPWHRRLVWRLRTSRPLWLWRLWLRLPQAMKVRIKRALGR